MKSRTISNLTQYVPQFKEILRKFLAKEYGESDFMFQLRGLERKVKTEIQPRPKMNEGIWFRFFEGDTGATTLNNLEYYVVLKKGGAQNYAYYIRGMEVAISKDENPEVYFS